MEQKTRIKNWQKPAELSVFKKQQDIVYKDFTSITDRPEAFKQGILTGEPYKSAIYFYNDTSSRSPDLPTIVEVGLKLL